MNIITQKKTRNKVKICLKKFNLDLKKAEKKDAAATGKKAVVSKKSDDDLDIEESEGLEASD